MAGRSSAAEWLRQALDASMMAAACWRGVHADDGHLVDLEVVDASVGFGAWLGRPHRETIGRRYSELIPTGLHDRLPVYLRSIESGEPANVVFDRVTPDGAHTTAEIRAVPVGTTDVFIALWDVSDSYRRLHDAERERSRAIATRDLLVAALNASPDAFAIYEVVRDTTGAVRRLLVEHVNEVAAARTGRAPDGWTGADARDLLRHCGCDRLHAPLVEAAELLVTRRTTTSVRATGGWSGEIDVVLTPFGVDRLVTTWRPAGSALAAGTGGPATSVVSRTDSLTGLLDRGEFRRRLSQQLGVLRPEPAPGVVVVIDLDDFGRLNDLVGTQRADAALATFGVELRSLMPWLLHPARVGGDECAFVLPGPVDDALVDLAWARVGEVVARVVTAHRLPVLTVSAGVRRIEPGLTVDDLLRDCDTALRHSVRNGGDRLTVYSEQVRHSLLVDYLEAEDIRQGLAAGQFRLARQPVVRIDSGTQIGDEALLRWLHPEYGILPPSRIVPVAEATGLIVDLGAWVVDQGVATLAATPGDRHLGINVSGTQMLSSDVPAVVAAALETHRADPGRLIVEITESAMLPDSRPIREQLVELRQMGVGVAIDDFGSGYSSVARLDWVPVDVVKLDRLFLAGELDARRRGLLRATVELVQSIGALSLAEGIESARQWEVVAEAGVDLGQGYLFGRPALAEDGCDA